MAETRLALATDEAWQRVAEVVGVSRLLWIRDAMRLYEETRTAFAGEDDARWPRPAAEVRETARKLAEAACAVWAVSGELVLPREPHTLLLRGILDHVLADDRDLLDARATHVSVRDPWVLGLLAARCARLAQTYRDRPGPEPDWPAIELVWRIMGVIEEAAKKATLSRDTRQVPRGTLFEVLDAMRPSLPGFAELTPEEFYAKVDDARRRRRRRQAGSFSPAGG
jgi:hypothetical protein